MDPHIHQYNTYHTQVWDIFLYSYLSSVGADEDVRSLMDAHRSGDYETKMALHDRHYPSTSAALLEHVDSFIEDIDAQALAEHAALVVSSSQ